MFLFDFYYYFGKFAKKPLNISLLFKLTYLFVVNKKFLLKKKHTQKSKNEMLFLQIEKTPVFFIKIQTYFVFFYFKKKLF